MKISIAAALAAIAALGTACGGGSAKSSNPASDLQIARSELLVLSDFPPAWNQHGTVTNGTGASALSGPQSANLANCLGVAVSVINSNPPSANSPSFSDNTGALTVDDQAQVYPNADAAKADFDTLQESQAPGCLVQVLGSYMKQQISASLQRGQSIGQITASSKSFKGFGDRSGALELKLPITSTGQVVEVYADLYVVLKGRSETTLLTLSPASPFPSALAGQLAAKATARMS